MERAIELMKASARPTVRPALPRSPSHDYLHNKPRLKTLELGAKWGRTASDLDSALRDAEGGDANARRQLELNLRPKAQVPAPLRRCGSDGAGSCAHRGAGPSSAGLPVVRERSGASVPGLGALGAVADRRSSEEADRAKPSEPRAGASGKRAREPTDDNAEVEQPRAKGKLPAAGGGQGHGRAGGRGGNDDDAMSSSNSSSSPSSGCSSGRRSGRSPAASDAAAAAQDEDEGPPKGGAEGPKGEAEDDFDDLPIELLTGRPKAAGGEDGDDDLDDMPIALLSARPTAAGKVPARAQPLPPARGDAPRDLSVRSPRLVSIPVGPPFIDALVEGKSKRPEAQSRAALDATNARQAATGAASSLDAPPRAPAAPARPHAAPALARAAAATRVVPGGATAQPVAGSAAPATGNSQFRIPRTAAAGPPPQPQAPPPPSTAGAGAAGAPPAQSAPAQGAPAQGAPAQGAPAQGAPAQGAPALNAPALNAPAQNVPRPATLVVAGEVVELIGRTNCELALLLALAHAAASRRLRARFVARESEHAPRPPGADAAQSTAQPFLPGWD
jgi:hypothetical protein